MSRHHYNADALMLSDGWIDHGEHVPCGAQIRRKIVVEKRSGYEVQAFRRNNETRLGAMDYECDTLEAALYAFDSAVNMREFRYITLTDLSTNTIIKDHSTKDTNP